MGALSGLLAVGSGGCSGDDTAVTPSGNDLSVSLGDLNVPTGADMTVSYNVVVSTTPITFDQFVATCRTRGGLVQTTASCSGNNACRGLSYLHGTLTDHSCRAMNSCGPGMSCVDLRPDSGKSGKEIYEKGTCAPTCHAQFSPSYDPSIFNLMIRPGTVTLDAGKARFLTGSKVRLESIIAFGVQGTNDDGTAYHTMPQSYSLYSLAEIDRVIDYIRTLNVVSTYYGIPGAKDGGAP